MSVLVLLAQGCEELEAITIIDLLRRAQIEVVSASLDEGEKVNPVTASRGVVIIPDMTLDQALRQEFEMVVLPGGLPGADHLQADARVIALIQQMQQKQKAVAAICAAPRVLAHAGIVSDKTITAYPGVFNADNTTASMKLSDQAVVVDQNVITSKGPATAMPFALQLIEQLKGSAVRDEVAKGLLY